MSDICVILGNGPSLKGFDFFRLTGVRSLGMNAAYRYWDEIDWYPDYYACLDDQLIISHHDEIYRMWQQGQIRHFFVHGSFFDYHPDCICAEEFTSLDQVLPHWYRKRGQGQGWEDLTTNPAFRTSDTTKVTTGAFATRYCAYKGHDTLALMGIDLKYVEILPEAEKADGVKLVMKETPKENPNYFFDSYQQAGDKYNIPNPDVHNNALHIDSFRLITSDFARFGQTTRIFNTNPNSLLEDENVFPLRPIGDVLVPHALGAVVVPTTQFEIDAVLANFDIWALPEYAPLAVTDPDNRCALVFMFNNDTSAEHEPAIRARFKERGMERYFSYLRFEYLGLAGDDDKYERDYSKKVGDQGFKSGPNNQFFLTMQAARDLGLGRYVFQMETDNVPLQRGWLSALRKICATEPPFWLLGSRYHGVEELSPSFANHLNGNAVYATGDPGFQNFLDTFWEPRTREMVKGVDKRLAYDCILEKVFTEQKDDPEVAAVLANDGDKFRETPYILNISGKRDLSDLDPDYEAKLLETFPGAYVLHNRAAQQQVAAQAERQVAQLVQAQSRRAPVDHPRLLIFDMTPMGNGTATGEVKSNLLRGWPEDRLLQVASPSEDVLSLVRPDGAGAFGGANASEQDIRAAIAEFDPQVILYRPLAERAALHKLALQTIEALDVPVVSWIMDDWPARLFAEDKVRFGPLDRDLRDLLRRSALRLSICDAMSDAFTKRYGQPFKAYANGVDPHSWTTPRKHADGPIVLRYAGGLAPDMQAESVQRVAKAVEELARGGLDVRFEINTQSWWVDQSGHLFNGLKYTKITSERRDTDDYRKWLCEADALLISYNFDHASLRYVMYSMANKMPECLASGAALLVHGPRSVATVDYLARGEVAEVVDKPEIEALKAAIKRLADPAHRTRLSDAGRRMVFDRHSLPKLADNFAHDLEAVRAERPTPACQYFHYADGRDMPQPVSGPAELRTALETGGQGLVVFDDPAEVLAHVFARRGQPDDALEDWANHAEAALALYRSDRSRISLVDRSRMAASRETFQAMLEAVFPGVHLPPALRLEMARSEPILFTLAELQIRGDAEVGRLLAQLRASSLRPEGQAAGSDPDLTGALGSYQALADRKQSLREKSRELAALFAETTALREERNTLHAQMAALNGRLSEIGREGGAKQEQLAQLQETCKTYFEEAERNRQRHVQQSAELSDLAQERDRLKRQLEEVYKSTSWRLTGPVRGFKRLLKGQNPRGPRL